MTRVDVLRWVAIGLFSVLVPVGIFVGRMNVRVSRREIVRDLERLFHFATVEGQPLILPSFELVKYKYDPEFKPGTGAGRCRRQLRPLLHFSGRDLHVDDLPRV